MLTPKRTPVYFCHPLRGNTPAEAEANRKAAGALVAKFVRWAEDRGQPIIPVAPWIHLAEHVSEEDGRALGLIIDCAAIELCKELWVIGPQRPPSAGMIVELNHAVQCSVLIQHMQGFTP
jgi:hypothetical protein